MKKNVAGQVVGAQLVSATDGSNFTGTAVVYVTGDGGTQSSGAGTVQHEGNGYHSYFPTQAETNYDHIAFTFTGTGAVTATAQLYTTFPQSGDSFTRVGAPSGASISADIAAVKAQASEIETDTQDIQSRIPAALVSGRMDASVGEMAVNTLTASALAADAVNEIQNGLASQDSVNTIPTASENADAVRTELTTELSRIDVDISTRLSSADYVGSPTADENAEALLIYDMSTITGEAARSPLNAFRILRNRMSTASGDLVVYKEDDATEAWTATLTTDSSAEPITGTDPA